VFLPALVRHCARWRTLKLEFDATWSPHPAFADLVSMPLLEALVFSGRGVQRIKGYNFFKDAPHLRRVVLGSPGKPSVPEIQLPWGQLTTYKATYSASTHLRNLSNAAHTLVECDLGLASHVVEDDALGFRGTMTLPRLRRLVINRTASAFLNCLATPALHDLHICDSIHYALPFLHRSACALSRLTLFMCTPTPAVVLLLQATPTLTTLDIDFLGETNSLISALAGTPDVPPLCPGLTSLSWGDRRDTIDRAAFVDMIESRWRSASKRRLRFVGVYPGRMRMKAQRRRLLAFADEGLEVEILNGRKGERVMAGWREY
jgi:hypothetical protein